MSEEQRKLAAIMFTDMVGYSALSQRDEKLAQELLEEHRPTTTRNLSAFYGTEIKTISAAFLVGFNSAFAPFWDPLRGDPRFENMVQSLIPKWSPISQPRRSLTASPARTEDRSPR